MVRCKNEVRLHNVLFPIWFFFVFPTVAWKLLLPANFVIDSVVLLAAAARLGLEKPQRRTVYRQSILPVWLIGFFSDAVGGALIFGLTFAHGWLYLPGDIWRFPGTTLISLPGVLAAGVLIYWLNRTLSFRRSGLATATLHKLCLALAVFTAPYAMLIPLYG